jgi:thioredoxin reductase
MELTIDYLIVGAGPAGLQLGYYLEKSGRNYLILERSEVPGAFFRTFPRHRKLISINKPYTGYSDPEINLRWDWNSLLSDSNEKLFKNYSMRYFPDANDLTRYLCDFSAHFNLKVKHGVQVVSITQGEKFRVVDHLGNIYHCSRLIVATGVSKPYIPPIPGIEFCDLYSTITVDPSLFTNQRVLIIGKGNSAFETAENLCETAAVIHLVSPSPIKMAWKTHFVGNLRAVNNNLLDTYQLKSQNAILDASVEEIRKENGRFKVTLSYTHAYGETETLFYDRVIACTGFRFDSSLFDKACRPHLTIEDRFPEQTSEWESTNIKDLYFAGTLMQMRDYKKQMSGFIHGFRYNIRALHQIFETKYHKQEWPYRLVKCNPKEMTRTVIERINISSAMWQQPGFIGDLITVPNYGKEARHYSDIPVDYVRDHLDTLRCFGEYYLVTLEYGHSEDHDPFNVVRINRSDISNSSQSTFLHPIVRGFSGAELESEHHIIEDLAAEWREDVHIMPLQTFFTSDLRRAELLSAH